MQNLLPALIAAKREFSPIAKTGYNPHYKSKYATLANILDSVNPAMHNHGLCLVQPLLTRSDRVLLQSYVYHAASTECLGSEVLLPEAPDPQRLGAIISYYRRYAICSLLSLSIDGDDLPSNSQPHTGRAFEARSSSSSSPHTRQVNTDMSDVVACFELLGWDTAQRAAWGETFRPGKPSRQWSAQDWISAKLTLWDLINKPKSSDEIAY